MKDLTGQRFGKLTVIRRAEQNKVYGGIERTTWHCKCDCGNEVDVITTNLTGGTTKSCGCGRDDFKLKDLTGKRFGKLTVIERGEDREYGNQKVITWNCRCDCGNVINTIGNNLKRGLSNACGYCRNYTDLTGQRFGKLTVIEKCKREKIYGDNKYIAWKCRCDCGNVVEVIGEALKSGNTTSCGCKKEEYYKEKIIDLTGKRFGMLTVIGKSDKVKQYKNQKLILWKCRCDCGNIVEVTGAILKAGKKTSCGCKRKNKKEK